MIKDSEESVVESVPFVGTVVDYDYARDLALILVQNSVSLLLLP